MRSRLPLLGAALTVAAVLVGCEKGPPAGPPLATPHPVHGKITFPDKTPLKGGVITFTPVEIHVGSRLRYEAAGLVDASGNYKLGFNGDGTGVPPGEYKVTIMPRDYQELPGSNSGKIPKQYQQPSSTPLKNVTVAEGENELNFVLQ
jgi:hypothetical protein